MKIKHLFIGILLATTALNVAAQPVSKQYFVPKGHTHLQSGDRLLVISDNDEELRKSYESLGISRYTMRKNR